MRIPSVEWRRLRWLLVVVVGATGILWGAWKWLGAQTYETAQVVASASPHPTNRATTSRSSTPSTPASKPLPSSKPSSQQPPSPSTTRSHAAAPHSSSSSTSSAASPSTAPKTNPYRSIALRNPFGLVPPPPPQKPKPPPPKKPEPQDLGELKLSGITTLLGKRAMFVLIRGRTNLYSGLVAEGERDAVITNLEVLKIDPEAGKVKVVFAGKEMELNFEENGLKLAKAPPPSTRKTTSVHTTTRRGGATPPPFVGTSTRSSSSIRRILPTPTTTTTRYPSSQTTRSLTTRTYIPPRPTGVGRSTRPTGSALVRTIPRSSRPPQPQLSPEEIRRRQEAQQQLARELGIPMPPLPPLPTPPTSNPTVPKP